MQLEDLSFVTAVTGRPVVQSPYWLTGLRANVLLALLSSCCFFRFGRMPTYLISTVAFIGATLGCVFAPTAPVLVLFRALQGAGGRSRGRKRGRERGASRGCTLTVSGRCSVPAFGLEQPGAVGVERWGK